jgi:hypothetical protein
MVTFFITHCANKIYFYWLRPELGQNIKAIFHKVCRPLDNILNNKNADQFWSAFLLYCHSNTVDDLSVAVTALDSVMGFQVAQMGQGFAGGKPLLSCRELVPAAAGQLPGHP